MTSIITVTLNRKVLAEYCLGPALQNAGAEFEFLSADNGSTDGVQDYAASLHPVFHRLNTGNEGYAQMLNQMLLRARGEYLCVLDPDLALPNDWLKILVNANRAIPDSGVSGYHCVLNSYPEVLMNGFRIRPGEEIFGLKFFNRRVLNEVGYFDELALYGLEDAAYFYRLKNFGFVNYYISNHPCRHIGEDGGEKTPYRDLKWEQLELAKAAWMARRSSLDRQREEYDKASRRIYYVGPPEERWKPELIPEALPSRKSFLKRLWQWFSGLPAHLQYHQRPRVGCFVGDNERTVKKAKRLAS